MVRLRHAGAICGALARVGPSKQANEILLPPGNKDGLTFFVRSLCAIDSDSSHTAWMSKVRWEAPLSIPGIRMRKIFLLDREFLDSNKSLRSISICAGATRYLPALHDLGQVEGATNWAAFCVLGS